ncbi:unnamed protein product, partial [Mesorhabditis belari]|uniref:Uncharacterized protein n=1 Tax=Mesorhabditis belari TaxID=2138241 RepID=A0AAF3J3G6_9BILA
MGFFSVSFTVCLVLLVVVTAEPDSSSVDRVRRDMETEVMPASRFIRACTADELSKGCTEAPTDFGPAKKLCTCSKTEAMSASRFIRACTADELSKGCTEAPTDFGPAKKLCTCSKTEAMSASRFIRACTADELSKGCTEAPTDFGPDKKLCTCSKGRVRRNPDAQEEAKTTVHEHPCSHEELVDKHCTLVADIGQPLRCHCPE